MLYRHVTHVLSFCLLIALNITFAYSQPQSVEEASVLVGADRLEILLPMLEGKRVALASNHSGVLSDPQHTMLLDTLLREGVEVKKLFSPEHGFRGTADAGEKVSSTKDTVTGLPIVSLYGRKKRPSQSDLAGIDVLLIDFQDVGVRFFTYSSTMYYLLDACAESSIPVVVLDRPNPHDTVDGPMLDPNYKSFISLLSIPAVHGLTMGEMAKMIEGEGWLTSRKKLQLTVVPCLHWRHGQAYTPPVPPSPNLRSARALELYPTLCYLEGTSWSVGRGTDTPFEVVGYPNKGMGGYTFIPRSLQGASKPLHEGLVCYGPDLSTRQFRKGINLELLIDLYQKSKKNGVQFFTRKSHFDLLAGSMAMRTLITSGVSAQAIRKKWEPELKSYRLLRERYLLYK